MTLEDAYNAAEKMGFKLSKLIVDQEKWNIAWLCEYPGKSKKKAILLAAERGHIVNGEGYCKSIDYLCVKKASEKGCKILLHIDDTDNLYEVEPKRIINYIEKNRKNNLQIQDISSALSNNICPVCGDRLKIHKENCIKPSPNDAYECYHHRLKYYDVPLVKVYAQNLNRGKTVKLSNAEEFFQDLFEKFDLPFKFTGNDSGIATLWGFKVDFVHIQHGEWGIEYHTNREDNTNRRRIAEEHGCILYTIEKPWQKYKINEKLQIIEIKRICKYFGLPLPSSLKNIPVWGGRGEQVLFDDYFPEVVMTKRRLVNSSFNRRGSPSNQNQPSCFRAH